MLFQRGGNLDIALWQNLREANQPRVRRSRDSRRRRSRSRSSRRSRPPASTRRSTKKKRFTAPTFRSCTARRHSRADRTVRSPAALQCSTYRKPDRARFRRCRLAAALVTALLGKRWLKEHSHWPVLVCARRVVSASACGCCTLVERRSRARRRRRLRANRRRSGPGSLVDDADRQLDGKPSTTSTSTSRCGPIR